MALMLACGYTYGIHPARMTCAHIMSSSTPDAIAHRIGPHPVADGGEDGARFEALRIALYLYLYLFNGPGREDVIGQVGCLRPVVKKNCL